MIVQGKVHLVKPVTKPTDKLTKRVVILDLTTELNGRPNPWFMSVEVKNAMTEDFNENPEVKAKYNVGDDVTVDISIGNYQLTQKDGQWNCYNNVDAWRMKHTEKIVAPAGSSEDKLW